MVEPTVHGALGKEPRCFTFGDCTVDPSLDMISGPAATVHVDPKVMDVLVYLARHAGEVVSQEQLLGDIWQGRFVSSAALSRCIYQLRRHLVQATGRKHSRAVLETIPKRGYRLTGPAPVFTANSIPAPSETIAAPGDAGRHAVTRPARIVVVVLALAVSGAFLGYSIRNAAPPLPTQNAQAYDAYASAMEYYDRTDRYTALPYAESLLQTATALDPDFALAWAALARVDTDIYWHGIDRSPERLQLAERAITQLSALQPDSADAHFATANYLMKGLGRFDDALAALQRAEQAGIRDPELWFLQAMAHRRVGRWKMSETALDKAIGSDPRNVIYLRQQHITYLFLRRYDEADQMLDRILALAPDNGTAYVDKVVTALCRDGDTTPAHRYDAKPPSAFYDEGLAYPYTRWLVAIYDGDYAKALEILDALGDEPILDGDLRNLSNAPKSLYYARTYRLAGRLDEARDAYTAVIREVGQRIARHSADDHAAAAGLYLALAESQAGLGQTADALRWLDVAQEQIAASGDEMSALAFQVAAVVRVLAPAGLTEEAIHELDDYLARPAGHWSFEGLRADPRLEPILRNWGQ